MQGHEATDVSSLLPGTVLRITKRLASGSIACTKSCLYAITPQLIRSRYFNDRLPAPKISSTSWMNGIRGIAAICVFSQHYFARFTNTIFSGYGAFPTDVWIHQLPGFQLFYNGRCAVMLFFTIGGYVCGYKPLQAITDSDYTTFATSVPTSVFRRWFRLYLPVFCLTFAICVLGFFDVYKPTHFIFEFEDLSTIFPGRPVYGAYPHFPTVALQLRYWWISMLNIMNFWVEFPTMPPIAAHLWTIVQEFRGSMHLYIAIFALAACKAWARIAGLVFLSFMYVGVFGHWVPVCFFSGAAIAQIDILRSRNERARQLQDHNHVDVGYVKESLLLDDPDLEAASTAAGSLKSEHRLGPLLRRYHAIFSSTDGEVSSSWRLVLYCLAIYLMSFPLVGIRWPTPLYKYTVLPLIPYWYDSVNGCTFPVQIGLILLLYLLSSQSQQQRTESLWHRILTTKLFQYLGSIMFGAYLVHPFVLRFYGFTLTHLVWRTWDVDQGVWVYAVPQDMKLFLFGLFVGWSGSLIGLLWLADVWTREVEGRCMRLTKALEQLVFIKR